MLSFIRNFLTKDIKEENKILKNQIEFLENTLSNIFDKISEIDSKSVLEEIEQNCQDSDRKIDRILDDISDFRQEVGELSDEQYDLKKEIDSVSSVIEETQSNVYAALKPLFALIKEYHKEYYEIEDMDNLLKNLENY